MIASLPMYDRPETAAANDRLWDLVLDNLHLEKCEPPERLTRGGDIWDQWLSPDLLLSQTCGFPYRARLHGKVAMVGTPVHDLPCQPGYYYSVIVARKQDRRIAFRDFADAQLAYNEPMSQSGWAAPWAFARDHGFAFSKALETGAHRASANAVAEGRADIAAIDAVSWVMMQRWDDFAEALREVAHTPPTPALPFISATGQRTDDLQNALRAAIRDLAPEDRDILCLKDMTAHHPDAYLSVPTPPPPPKPSASGG